MNRNRDDYIVMKEVDLTHQAYGPLLTANGRATLQKTLSKLENGGESVLLNTLVQNLNPLDKRAVRGISVDAIKNVFFCENLESRCPCSGKRKR